MAEKSADLPEECWELILKQLLLDLDPDHPSPFNSLSLVSKQFLSFTNRLLSTLKLKRSDPALQSLLPRLLRRFPRLKHIDLAKFHGDMNPILHQIALSGLNLESLNVSDQATLPAVGLRSLGSKLENLKSLNCSKIRCFGDSDLNLIADSFPCLEELDIGCPDDEYGFSPIGISDSTPISRPISDSGILSLSKKLKSLRKIHLSGNSFITDKSLVCLSTNCLFLCQIVLNFCHFITLNGISKLLCDCRQLNYISARSLSLDVPPQVPFISWKALLAIDLSGWMISDEFLDAVAEAHLPLKQLILSGCTNYSFAGIRVLLSEYQSLEYLDLESAHFLRDKDMAELSLFLHSIRYINLNYCSKVTDITFYILITSCLVLDTIEMAGTGIGDGDIETDCKANNQMKSLNLAQNSSIDDAFLTSFASIFPNLEVLDLSGCKGVSEEGIMEVLKRCSEIRELKIDGRVRKNLCLLLEFQLPKLTVLKWMRSGIDDEALAMIGKRCPSLQKLNLAGSGSLTSEGVKGVVKNCKRLREINLWHCKNVSADIVSWMVFSSSLKKIVPPPGYVHTESQRNFFLLHGCLVCE
ncbi:hypothetical protein FF1_025235 [Malus domestica]|uniref:uncharacterized protein LOC126610736 n=1 Tax=Malus sylvestris TaxID=3752 RepID=UPI0021ACAB34|nr:uncharacterized protein LOC126610736 [Malus sylvestris]